MDQDLLYNTQSFGAKLKKAREEAGFDINTLSRRLHIRADIIKTIENCDFDQMPASGYAKNMIRSYARTVGLNQNEIAEQYLSEYEEYLRRGERHDTRASRRGGSSRYQSSRNQSRRYTSGRYSETKSRLQKSSIQEGNETSFDNVNDSRRATKLARQDRASDASRLNRASRKQARQENKNSIGTNFASTNRTTRNASRRNNPRTKDMSSSYSLGKKPGVSLPSFDVQKLLIVGVSILVLVLVITIAILLLGKNNKQDEDVPTMPISGLTDTSNKDDPTATAEDSKVADHATIKVKVDSGSQSWCIVTIDGNQDFAGIIDGGETKSWDVTGSFEFQTANSSPIKLTVDDKEQTLTADTSTGYYTFSYTFEKQESSTSGATAATASDTSTKTSTS